MARRQAAATSWARGILVGLSKSREHRAGIEPASPQYGCGVVAARPPVHGSVGPEGLEPSPGGLRVRCAAASTLVPSESARRESNPRPGPYKGPALTAELRATRVNRAGGTRTPTCRIKSPVCCQLHHDPVLGRAYAFQPGQHRFAPLAWIVLSGSPENRTRRHVVISRVWATSPRLPQSRSGWQDSNQRSRAPRARGSAATLHPVSQNGRI